MFFASITYLLYDAFMFLSRVTIIISLLFVLAGGAVFYISYNSFVDQQYALAESVDDQTIQMLRNARENKTSFGIFKKKPANVNVTE